MTPEFFIDFAKQAMIITILLSLPALIVGLVVGLAISIFQAVTSIQEMTLSFVPKIIAMFIALIVAAPWMLEKITAYATMIIGNIPMYIR